MDVIMDTTISLFLGSVLLGVAGFWGRGVMKKQADLEERQQKIEEQFASVMAKMDMILTKWEADLN